ncbi:MAG TPA: efflux RND transporter periplasmic adaptor subunit, partial [Polyangiaceae bacterium]
MSQPSHDDLDFELPPPPRVSATKLIVGGIVVTTLLGILFLVGYLPRRHEREGTAQTAIDNTDVVPRVGVVRPKPGASTKSLALPGSIEPLEQTTIYPRANGYVRKWLVDLGDRVKEGQSLVEIETPELDQDMLQGRATLAQGDAAVVEARTNRDLAKTEFDRATALVAAGVTSQQDLDQRRSTLAASESKVKVAEAQRAAYDANLHRLQQLSAYARVEAPFDGVVVERKV